jgi:hypothetical protein
MIQVGSVIKVHLIDRTNLNRYIQTTHEKNGTKFIVYKKNGKLGINWEEEQFTPLENFCNCEFEEVE